MKPGDTICALSSGSGRSGVAVIRLSGRRSHDCVLALAGVLPRPRELLYRAIKADDGEVLDKALVCVFSASKSATGEDMAEFHLHGSPAIVARVLGLLSAMAGVRLAEAGEFSRRAYENGKLDLVEAEGLADLLAAETESQRRLAMRQFLGEASGVYEHWRMMALACLASVESVIDFADEDGVAEAGLAALRPRLEDLIAELEKALTRSSEASAVRRGLAVVIAGAPNAGKSSLANALAGREMSIVSPVAGTTRDVVSDVLLIGGVPVRIVDTAGLRGDAGDSVEEEGIRRALGEIAQADVLVWLVAADDESAALPFRKPDVLVLSKADLGHGDSIRMRDETPLAVSVATGTGLDDLRNKLTELVRARLNLAEDGIMVRARHTAAVNKALMFLRSALGQEAAALELLAEDVRNAAQALAAITGRVDVEDVLGQIFSEFCIGK